MSIFAVIVFCHNPIVFIPGGSLIYIDLTFAKSDWVGHSLLDMFGVIAPESDSDVLGRSSSKDLGIDVVTFFRLCFSQNLDVVG